jgi:hypothetical protein
MDGNRMPGPKRGERNIFCPYYSECLNYAVKKAWVHWTCLQCGQRFEREPLEEGAFTSQDTVCYYDVLLEGRVES